MTKAGASPIDLAVERLARVIATIERGQPLALDDAEFMLHGLRRSIFEKTSIENSWGLGRGWRTLMRDAELRAAVETMVPRGAAVRPAAKSLLTKLAHYRARSFDLDKSRPPQARTNAAFFAFLESRGGKVPSFSWLRAFLAGQKNGVFSGHDLVEVE